MSISCWANSLGDCSTAQSKEHLISECLFPSGHVIISGLPWCKESPRRLPSRTLSSNILCTRHNNLLSEIDAEGGRAMQIFRDIKHPNHSCNDHPTDKNCCIEYHIDGRKLERWFLKSTINLANILPGTPGWFETNTLAANPPHGFLEAIFGRTKLSRPFGLFIGSVGIGGTISLSDDVTWRPLFVKKSMLVGA